MNDRNDGRTDWTSRDRWQDSERRDHGRNSDYSGEFAPEFARDQWSRSGSTGAATPRGNSTMHSAIGRDWDRNSDRNRDMRGDRRTHDWEVGDRNYTRQQYGQNPGQNFGQSSGQSYGQSYGQQSQYSGQSGSQFGEGYRSSYPVGGTRSPDYFTGDDYGDGQRAWGAGSGNYPSYGGYSGGGSYGNSDPRGFADRAIDEVRSWFGDDDAQRRREEDHRGRGPSDYTRSDERIREDANDRLTENPRVDARSISVMVTDGEVTLSGTVNNRMDKRRAEDCVEAISGVKHVQNNLRVKTGSSLEGQGGTLGWGGGDKSVTPEA
ncbi:BON domain-containing protein [Novosphingobium sp. B1]|uniref:BON domain-containing protein n=1 Tax=Novosphingobium sp. B1 TaxID=1938756 RepID=UPI0009D79D47|nr:BON domain-containing protein [Novosphingobium sp. B1]SMC72369.1 BON domain-containing protein [Novosphingobium sp. B1]